MAVTTSAPVAADRPATGVRVRMTRGATVSVQAVRGVADTLAAGTWATLGIAVGTPARTRTGVAHVPAAVLSPAFRAAQNAAFSVVTIAILTAV